MAWRVTSGWGVETPGNRPADATCSLFSDRDSLLYHDNTPSPSVVARLMGVDNLPILTPNLAVAETEFNLKKMSSCLCYEDSLKLKPKKREHPQEEELQRFKKEFDVWQAARFHSHVVKCSRSPQGEELTGAPNNSDIDEDSWSNTPISREDKTNLKEFLEEVKERLRSEYQVKEFIARSTTVRGGGIETPNREKPSKPVKIAQRIAKGMRHSVSMDFCLNFPNPEIWMENEGNCLTGDRQGASFRREELRLSPGCLTRSFSAPLSAKSLEKLLVEPDKKQKRDKLSIREKVSSLGYSLGFGGKLFRKRVKLRDITTSPIEDIAIFEAHENSTEVPPSPASVCSSAHEEFWRLTDDNGRQSSENTTEDSDVLHVFREINSNLNELRRKLNQLEGSAPEIKPSFNYKAAECDHKLALASVNDEALPMEPQQQHIPMLSRVWGIIQEFPVESMLAEKFSSSSSGWTRRVDDDDMKGIVKDVERHIFRSMIAETVLLLLA